VLLASRLRGHSGTLADTSELPREERVAEHPLQHVLALALMGATDYGTDYNRVRTVLEASA